MYIYNMYRAAKGLWNDFLCEFQHGSVLSDGEAMVTTLHNTVQPLAGSPSSQLTRSTRVTGFILIVQNTQKY